MKNKILHALSNRPGPFLTPLFSQTPTFVPDKIDPDQAAFRRKLFLDITTTDYYLKAYLALLHSFRDLEALCQDTVTTYSLNDFAPRGVSIDNGAEFLSTPRVWGHFTDPPITALPVNLTYQLRYVSAGFLDMFAIEAGLTRRTSYHVTGTDPNKIMRLDWQDFPFDGPLQLNQVWQTGATITIVVEPSRFPYDILWGIIQGDMWLNKKVMDENLMIALQSTRDIQEKVAIALLTLILSNNAVFGAVPVTTIPPEEFSQPSLYPSIQPVTIITNSPLPPAVLGSFYSLYFQAIGGTGRYKWSLLTGSIPDGLEFDQNGHLHGTPLSPEIDTFTVTAIDY